MIERIGALIEKWASEMIDAISRLIVLYSVYVVARDRVTAALSVLDVLESRTLDVSAVLFAMQRGESN